MDAYGLIEMRVSFLPPESGQPPTAANVVKISGGGAPAVSISRSLHYGAAVGEPTPFGLAAYELTAEEEGGAPDITAGSHPFQLTTSLVVNQKPRVRTRFLRSVSRYPREEYPGRFAPGLDRQPHPVPACSFAEFYGELGLSANSCPPQTVVGIAAITIDEPILNGVLTTKEPIFNLEPAYGEPARFGFAVLGDVPVFINASLRDTPGEGYAITAGSLNTTETASFLAASVTFWGTPGAASHDSARGLKCLNGVGCTVLGEENPPSFMTMPTSCSGAPIPNAIDINSWAEPLDTFAVPAIEPLPALEAATRCRSRPRSALNRRRAPRPRRAG